MRTPARPKPALCRLSWREIGITILFFFIFAGALFFGGSVSRNDAEELVILVYSTFVALAQLKRRIANAIFGRSDLQHNGAQIAD